MFAPTAGVLLLLLTGCAAPAPTAAPSFGYGSDAADIARSVIACRAISDQAVPAGTAGVTSIATCSITGSQVDFFVWKDAAAQTAGGLTTGRPGSASTEAYVAHGDGWDAVTHDSGRLGAQKLIATTVAASAGGTVVHVN